MACRVSLSGLQPERVSALLFRVLYWAQTSFAHECLWLCLARVRVARAGECLQWSINRSVDWTLKAMPQTYMVVRRSGLTCILYYSTNLRSKMGDLKVFLGLKLPFQCILANHYTYYKLSSWSLASNVTTSNLHALWRYILPPSPAQHALQTTLLPLRLHPWSQMFSNMTTNAEIPVSKVNENRFPLLHKSPSQQVYLTL